MTCPSRCMFYMSTQRPETSMQASSNASSPTAASAHAGTAVLQNASVSPRLPPLRLSESTQSFDVQSRPAPIEPRSLPQPSYNLNAFRPATSRSTTFSSPTFGAVRGSEQPLQRCEIFILTQTVWNLTLKIARTYIQYMRPQRQPHHIQT